MAEFNNLDIKIVDKGEQIVFDNKTNNALSIGVGIVFDKDGEYHVTVHNNRITVINENNIEPLTELPSVQPEIIYCKDCKYWCEYWNSGSCEYPEHIVNSQDYMIGDIETDAKHFCGYAEKRERK